MNSKLLLTLLIGLNCCFAQLPNTIAGDNDTIPDVWIDVSTGHKVFKLVDRPGLNYSFYFHNNPFLSSLNGKDQLMVFYGSTEKGSDLFYINLRTKETEQITHNGGSKRGEIIGKLSRKAFFTSNDSIFSVGIDPPHKLTLIKALPAGTVGSAESINADETKLAAVMASPKERDIIREFPEKKDFFDKIYEAKLLRKLLTIDIETGEIKEVYQENAWLNHVQFSPTDPDNLMYCHEGPWHKVDRIWNVDINTSENRLLHKRSMEMEIAGHEFFSWDGKTVWFDLQKPRGETFFLAGKNLETNELTTYQLDRNQWSIHFNISPDQTLFAGDGGDDGQVAHAPDGRWLYLFKPEGDHLVSEKLVNMKNHYYKLEPNVHFSPDGKWIIFRANFKNGSQIYAVEINK